MREHAAVGVAALQQFVVAALVDQFAAFQDEDGIGAANLRQAMGNQQRGAALQDAVYGLLDFVLGGAVDGAGRVVEHQDARVGQQGAGDGDALALPTRKGDTALANQRLVAVFEALDEAAGLRIARRLLDGLPVGILSQAIGDILGDGAREEEDVLLDARYLRAQGIKAPISHVYAVHQNAPLIDIVDAVDQSGERAFARAGLTNDGNGLPRQRVERDVFQHGRLAIAECDVLEDDVAAYLLAIAALVLVQFGLFFQNHQDTPRARHAQLHQAEGPVGVEGREVQ